MKKLTLVFLMGAAVQTLSAQPDSSLSGELRINVDVGITELQQRYIRENKRNPEIVGYRVQFFNGPKQPTLNARGRFISVFPSVSVYTLYETPEYRVQAGDFRTRLEAEKFLKEVIETYGSAFVIKTMIKLPKLQRPLGRLD